MPCRGTKGEVALEAINLAYRVDGARLLEGVNLRADRGEFIGLIGPNGSGKTTLLKTIAGVLRRQHGKVNLNGRDLADMSQAEIARTLAMVPQALPYTYGFTAMELVLMGRYPRMGHFEGEGPKDRKASEEAMGITDTTAFAQRTLNTLSGGERQRVILARALAQEPSILLLDEPTANLDILHQLKTLDLVRRLTNKGLTAIAAIHDLQLAGRYCDRLLLLHRGQVIAQGTPGEVLTADNIEQVFGVAAVVRPDPFTGGLSISLISPAANVVMGARPGRESWKP